MASIRPTKGGTVGAPPRHPAMQTGVHPRRINIQHRLVYEVLPDEHVVHILRMWTHYE